jgi:AsmA protein
MRALKIASIVIGSLLALVILGLVSILVFVDPNDYRDKIAAAVEQNTGRKLELPGELHLSIFPWLAISIGEARLGESPSFGTEPFVTLKEAKVGLRLWPLINGDLEVGNVRLVGMRVRLITDEQGRHNWDDLTSKQKENKPEESGGPTKLPTIAGLEIVDAAVLLEDRQAKTRQELRKFDLKVSRFVSGQSVTLDSAFELIASPQMQLAVKLDSKLTADLERNNFLLEEPNVAVTLTGADYPKDGVPVSIKAKSITSDLPSQRHTIEAPKIAITWKGKGLPEAGVPVSIAAKSIAADLATKRHAVDVLQLETTWKGEGFPAAGVPVKLAIKQILADLAAQTLKLDALGMNLAGADITANLSGKQILDAPQLTGRIDFKPVSLREFAPKLGVTLPVTRAPDTFKRFGFAGDVSLNKTSADFKAFTMLLDETTAKGSFGISDFASKALRFDLNVDRLNADRYRPPPSDEKAAPAPASKEEPAKPTDIPVDAIRSLNARGQLVVGEAVFAGIKFSKLRLGLNAKDGNVRLNPSEAAFYGGQYSGDVSIDASGEVPRLSLDEHIAGINFAPFFKDFFETTRVAGVGTANIKVTATGKNTDDLLRALNGAVDFNVKDGSLEGTDLLYEIRRARAVIRQQAVPARPTPIRTPFSALTGTAAIRDGVMSNQDLNVATEFMRITGAGNIDLVKDSVDYKLNALVLRLPKEGADAAQTQELVDAKIPMTVTGSLSDPKVRPDIGNLVKEQLKQEYNEKYKEKVDEKKEKVEKKLRDKLDERLKGIFGSGK